MVVLRKINVEESYDLTLEGKKDLEDLKVWIEDNIDPSYYDKYMKIRDKISKDDNNFKDFQKIKKMDPYDLKFFIDNFKSETDKRKEAKKGAKKIYSDSDWDIYKVTTYPAAQYYGSGTKWCITGRYPGHEGRGEEYFNDYIKRNKLDGGYYFCIDRSTPSRKYCVLRYNDGGVDSIWIPEDSEISDVDLYDVPGDLPEDVPCDGFNLGEEIQDYIENKGGSNYDPIDGLSDALGEEADNMDLNRIAELADQVGDYGLEDFDDFYNVLFRGNYSDDSKVEAFKILLDEEAPTENWLSYHAHRLGKKCLECLIDTVLDNPSYYDTDYFDHLFYNMCAQVSCELSLEKILGVLDNCSDDIIDGNINPDLLSDIVTVFDNNVFLNKKFFSTLVEHGLDEETFINQLYTFSMADRKYRIPLLKVGVEEGLVDLNKFGDYGNYPIEITPFMLFLTWNPSVEDVKWMINHGADPDIKDSTGDDAVEWADNSEIKELLEK